ncbi:hypothetical protein NHP190003_05660 [Helicobacter sp. NHP19-003]|uniref:Transmembrane protein n=1 Tax=Helicobacter gastrocanis TaxID=2849641 RepID=A0ABM7SHS7_9HELI|nr:hypothetical protein NHP190003_05660 [Helicobacter sp. NHP19-003]
MGFMGVGRGVAFVGIGFLGGAVCGVLGGGGVGVCGGAGVWSSWALCSLWGWWWIKEVSRASCLAPKSPPPKIR